jgi:hypothetical protein
MKKFYDNKKSALSVFQNACHVLVAVILTGMPEQHPIMELSIT